MMFPPTLHLPTPPHTDRTPLPPNQDTEPQRLWSHLLVVFRDISGAFDPFANDGNPQVRALGRLARLRRPQHADDYFALGDLCAELTIQHETLSSTYAAKTMAAYLRAAEIAPAETRLAHRMLHDFALWVVDAARTLGSDEALSIGLLVCERIRQLGIIPSPTEHERLRMLEARLHGQQTHRLTSEQPLPAGGHISAERESRMLCDRGQMLLRQNQASAALACFERAIDVDASNHTAWLWQALALTDLGRFEQALVSYDQALALAPTGASVWNSKGALLMELGQVEAALACFQKALDLSAATASVKPIYWLNCGKALYKLGCYQEALAALEQAHRLEPSAESAAGIAACREQLGQHA